MVPFSSVPCEQAAEGNNLQLLPSTYGADLYIFMP